MADDTPPPMPLAAMLHEHDEREGERHPGKCVSTEAAEEEAVESDHPGNGKQIEDVSVRKAAAMLEGWGLPTESLSARRPPA